MGSFQYLILQKLDKIIENQEKTLTALSDLQDAVSAEDAEIVQFLADVAAQVSGGVSASDAEAIVTRIHNQVTQLQAADPGPAPTP